MDTSAITDHLPAYLTVSEAALVLRVSAPTVRRQLALGELEGIRVGRQWRIDRDGLARRRNTTPPQGHGLRRDRRMFV